MSQLILTAGIMMMRTLGLFEDYRLLIAERIPASSVTHAGELDLGYANRRVVDGSASSKVQSQNRLDKLNAANILLSAFLSNVNKPSECTAHRPH